MTEIEVLRKVAERTRVFDYTEWFWGDAIALDGLLDASELLDDPSHSERIATFFEKWSQRPPAWTDHMTPGWALVRLAEAGAVAESLVAELATQFMSGFPRVGGAPLYRPDAPTYRQAVWVDSVYHVPSFLAAAGTRLDQPRLFDDALSEMNVHLDVLSSDTGPFLGHTYDTGAYKLHGYGWARGVGWALLGMVDTLALVPRTHPGWSAACERTQTMAAAVLAEQDDSGFWHTLIDERESYLESSTAGFFGAAFTKGVREGVLGEEFARSAELAWAAATSRVDDEGNFWGVSALSMAHTGPVDPSSLYLTIPTEVNVWGQGCALRFAAERIKSGLKATQGGRA